MIISLISLQEAGLVHKDLKYDNFMIDKEFDKGNFLTSWDDFEITLIDLGLARDFDMTLTASGNSTYKSVDFFNKKFYRI